MYPTTTAEAARVAALSDDDLHAELEATLNTEIARTMIRLGALDFEAGKRWRRKAEDELAAERRAWWRKLLFWR